MPNPYQINPYIVGEWTNKECVDETKFDNSYLNFDGHTTHYDGFLGYLVEGAITIEFIEISTDFDIDEWIKTIPLNSDLSVKRIGNTNSVIFEFKSPQMNPSLYLGKILNSDYKYRIRICNKDYIKDFKEKM